MKKFPFQYKHKKTGNIYNYLSLGFDKTRNKVVVIYCPDDNEHTIYTRDKEEFFEKFESLQ